MSDCLRPHGVQNAGSSVLHYLPEFAQIHVHWAPFSFCLQSCPASGSFPVSQFFTSGGQNIGALTSASILPMYIQGWVPLGLTGLIFLQSKGLSKVFSNTTVWQHQFFSAQSSLWSNSGICTWLLEKAKLWLIQTFVGKMIILVHSPYENSRHSFL